MAVPSLRGARENPPAMSEKLEKAAIVMLALDEERTHRIFSRLDEEEILGLSRAMASLGRADTAKVEAAIAEFRQEVGRAGHVFGTIESTGRLLRRLLPPEKAEAIIDEIKGSEGRDLWEKLAGMAPEMLARYLRGEYPQTAAVILSRLPPSQSARVLRLIPESLVEEIAIRLVRMDRIQRAVLAEVEETLKREFVSNFARGHDRNSVSTMAEMLNRADKETVQRIMATLEAKEPQAALRIRRAMFTFEDLARVDPTTLPVLIAECRADRLPVALHSASRELRELFLGHMSERAANMLRQEIEMLPPQRRRTIEEAQAEIIGLAKRLSEEGRIVILGEDEDASFDE